MKADTTTAAVPTMEMRGSTELRAAILAAFEQSAMMRAADETLRVIIADSIIAQIRATVKEHGPGATYGWFFGKRRSAETDG